MGKIITTLYVVWLFIYFLYLVTNEFFSCPLWITQVFSVVMFVVSILYFIRIIKENKRTDDSGKK